MKKTKIIFMLLLASTQLLNANVFTDFKQTIVKDQKKEEKDPVCKMKINPKSKTTLKYEHEKVEYSFCSEICKKNFIKQPSKYLKK